MRAIFIAMMALLLSMPTLAEEQAEHYTLAQFRQAAQSVIANPLGPNAKANCRTVVGWTVESPKVSVTIGPPILNIRNTGQTQAEMSLFCAYMAGQALTQLEHKVKGGYPEAGGEAVIAAYAKIQKAKPTYKNEAVDFLIQAKSQGRLAELLAPKGLQK